MHEVFVGLLVGFLSSFLVAHVFYRKSSEDSVALHRQAQLDDVLRRLKELMPQSWDSSVGGHDGVRDTEHWLICTAEIFEEQGFAQGAQCVREIIQQMKPLCSDTAPVSADDAEAAKRRWYLKIQAVSDSQPRSVFNRDLRRYLPWAPRA